jgi:hypothetical protein
MIKAQTDFSAHNFVGRVGGVLDVFYIRLRGLLAAALCFE